MRRRNKISQVWEAVKENDVDDFIANWSKKMIKSYFVVNYVC